MRNTIQKAGLLEQGFAGDVYEDMLFDEYTRSLTENSSFGMAEQAYLQMSRVHEQGSRKSILKEKATTEFQSVCSSTVSMTFSGSKLPA